MTGLRIGSLCSGYGGLDQAVQAVLGGTVVWHSETDPAASAVLATHYPGVPNHGDLTATDWSSATPVGVLTAGWPCQPFSTAGKRRGREDERAIWPAVARAVRDLRPRLVCLENVAAVIPAGELARAVGDLAALGYDAAWRCLRASDAGAPHRRNRVFVIAAADPCREQIGEQPVALGGRRRAAFPGPDRTPAADAPGAGRGPLQPEHVDPDCGTPVLAGQAQPGRRGGVASDTNGARQQQPEGLLGDLAERPDHGAAPDWGRYAVAIHRWAGILGRPSPSPVVVGRRGGRQLNPRFVEWLMGLPDGWVCDVPGLSRNDQLRLLGNGVVPQQGSAAISWLLGRLPREVAA